MPRPISYAVFCLKKKSELDDVAVDLRARADRVEARPERLRDLEELEEVQRAGRELVQEPDHVVAAGANRRAERRVGPIRRPQDVADLLQPRPVGGVRRLRDEEVE